MTTSWKQKFVGAIAAGAIVAGLFPMTAFGAGASVLDTTAADADPEGPGLSLVVTGLEAGDTATYYQIIAQDIDDESTDPATIGTQQWKLHANVDKNGDGIVDGTESKSFGHTDADGNAVDGLWVDELVISDYEVDDEENPTEVTSDTRQLTPDMVNAISLAIANNKAATAAGDAVADSDGSIIVTADDLGDNSQGMYMFLAKPSAEDANYLYKPIFVSNDYYNEISTPEDYTNQLDLLAGEVDEYGNPIGVDYPDVPGSEGNSGVFKRSPLTIDKKAGIYEDDGTPIDMQNDVAVGDEIDFTITVPIVTYSKNYLAPQFYITDTLTEGLKLVEGSIDVSVDLDGEAIDTAEDVDYKIYENKDLENNDLNGFVVKFFSDDPTDATDKQDGFLYRPLSAPTCTITYKALVTTEDGAKFAQQVNQMDNTATLNYSNDPQYVPDGYFDGDEPSDEFEPNEPTGEETPELEDKTRHYTFDIDANVLGPDQSESIDPETGEPMEESDKDNTSEIRKIWVDANGSVIQSRETNKVVKGGTEQNGGENGEYGWLEGAEFKLMKVQNHVTLGEGEEAFEDCDPVEIKFDATTHIKSDEQGAVRPTSDAKGYIAMKGLDAGTYELTEVKAPLGYAFNPNMVYTIKITPNYVLEAAADEEHPDRTTLDGKGSGDDLILESYKVEISAPALKPDMSIDTEADPVETICVYNIAKDPENPDKPASILDEDGNQDPTVTIDSSTFGSNTTAMIMNKKLGLLPATGGSGIIFYLVVGGAIAGTAAFLMKKDKEDELA